LPSVCAGGGGSAKSQSDFSAVSPLCRMKFGSGAACRFQLRLKRKRFHSLFAVALDFSGRFVVLL
jgi:hypothetical protein